MTLHAGTSGFSYPGWRGVFYPERLSAGRMFAHYASRLNAIEMNGSFYRMPSEAALAGWAATAPEGFRFSFKVHRGVSYSAAAFPKLDLAAEFARRLAPLGPMAGPVLLQFPPSAKPDPGLLDAILEVLAAPAAVEPRSEAWFTPEVEAVLSRRGAALVVTDEEKWPRAPQWRTSEFAYYRLRRDYSAVELSEWAGVLRAELRDLRDLHVFFKHEPEAPGRALALAAELGQG